MNYNDDLRLMAFFGERLTSYLDTNNRTQKELADHLGVSKQIVSKWCHGTRIPRMGKIQAIADFLNCEVTDLIDYEGTWTPDKVRDELFEKKKVLFSMSEKASEEDLDKIITIVKTIVGGDK